MKRLLIGDYLPCVVVNLYSLFLVSYVDGTPCCFDVNCAVCCHVDFVYCHWLGREFAQGYCGVREITAVEAAIGDVRWVNVSLLVAAVNILLPYRPIQIRVAF